MTDHPSPPFNALVHRLWTRIVSGDLIEIHAWNRARAEQGFVGTCRLCGGHLRPMPTTEHDSTAHVMWLEATCLLCGKTLVSPNGRTLRRSSRHTEMPTGWWEARERSLRGEGQ
jgi:hypothetical protein